MVTPKQEIRFQDVDYIYEIGAFDDYLICIPHETENDEDYVEIHMDDLSEYERKIFDFLTDMSKETTDA
jgi:hypothetical protein